MLVRNSVRLLSAGEGLTTVTPCHMALKYRGSLSLQTDLAVAFHELHELKHALMTSVQRRDKAIWEESPHDHFDERLMLLPYVGICENKQKSKGYLLIRDFCNNGRLAY